MDNMILVVLGGVVGGLLRGIMGIAKGLITKKDEQVNYKFFLVSLVVSGAVGLVAALMFPVDFKFAILAGYAGSDFLETLYKMKLKNKFESELEKEMEKKEKEGKENERKKELISPIPE